MSNTETPVDPLEARRAEVAQYDANIAMYNAIKATLPSEWPANLAAHKGRQDHQAAAAEVAAEDVELLAQLLFHDHCDRMARTELLERTKAAAILAVLEAQQNP